MVYYFNKYNLSAYSGSTNSQMKQMRKEVFKHLKKIAKEISPEIGLNLAPQWISKATFGGVLCDYYPQKKGPTIIGSHVALFKLVAKDIDYLVLSVNIRRNLKYNTIGGKTVLIINILRYKKFIDTFKDGYKRVKLFLNKDLSPEEEEIINDWIDSKERNEEKKIFSEEEIIESLPKDNPEKISDIISRMDRFHEIQIIKHAKSYEEKLRKFEEKVNNPKISEMELEKELHENIWIIDFRYNKGQFNVEKEFKTDVGRIDLFLSKNKTSKKRDVIIELKKAIDSKKPTIVKYRDKDAIGAEVGRALSQLVNYLEENKEKWKVQNGVLIIGREKEESFIQIFNQYLHGIEIKTYEQLIKDCRNVIENFKEPEEIEMDSNEMTKE